MRYLRSLRDRSTLPRAVAWRAELLRELLRDGARVTVRVGVREIVRDGARLMLRVGVRVTVRVGARKTVRDGVRVMVRVAAARDAAADGLLLHSRTRADELREGSTVGRSDRREELR